MEPWSMTGQSMSVKEVEEMAEKAAEQGMTLAEYCQKRFGTGTKKEETKQEETEMTTTVIDEKERPCKNLCPVCSTEMIEVRRDRGMTTALICPRMNRHPGAASDHQRNDLSEVKHISL